jgi:uncharacterized protein with HEPN domain
MRPTSPRLPKDILAASDMILSRVAGSTAADYERDPWFRAGVERQFEIIEEALRRLERHDPSVAASIPDYRDVIDFRNVLAHRSDLVEHADVWRYATEELPQLRLRVAALLAEAEQAPTPDDRRA